MNSRLRRFSCPVCAAFAPSHMHDHESYRRIVELHDRHAADFDEDRDRSLQEKHWLDRLLAHMPPAGTVLDLGCGWRVPIARYIAESRAVDGELTTARAGCLVQPSTDIRGGEYSSIERNP